MILSSMLLLFLLLTASCGGFSLGLNEFMRGMIGKHHSEETKAKLSQANLGKTMTAEAKAKLAAFWRGRKHSEKTKEKMRKAHINRDYLYLKGIKRSTETRKKMSEAKKGNKTHLWKDGRSYNPNYKIYLNRRRRALLKGAKGTFTYEEWKE